MPSKNTRELIPSKLQTCLKSVISIVRSRVAVKVLFHTKQHKISFRIFLLAPKRFYDVHKPYRARQRTRGRANKFRPMYVAAEPKEALTPDAARKNVLTAWAFVFVAASLHEPRNQYFQTVGTSILLADANKSARRVFAAAVRGDSGSGRKQRSLKGSLRVRPTTLSFTLKHPALCSKASNST